MIISSPFLPAVFINLAAQFSVQKMQKFPIEVYEVGERLDRYLKKSPIGWTAAQRLLRKKDILLQKKDGTMIKEGDYRLQQGDVLLVSKILKEKFGKPQIDEERAVPIEEASRILHNLTIYDNQHITVINKPAGFSVQGGLNPRTNLFSLMSSKYKRELIHVTHRLDRCTTGLVVMAKNKQNAQFVQMAMEEKNMFKKYYLALTQGKSILEKSAHIRANIQWTNKNKARICSEAQENSKDCTTFYTPLGYQKTTIKDQVFYRNLLGIKLLTGRKHQIRCHLSGYLEQPILNDTKYGGYKLPDDKPSHQSSQKQDQESLQTEEQEIPYIYLHAFGIQIRKREIVDKVRLDKGCYFNESKGSVNILDDRVIFTAKVPDYWPCYAKSQQPQQLLNKIENKQSSLKLSAPHKRNITTII